MENFGLYMESFILILFSSQIYFSKMQGKWSEILYAQPFSWHEYLIVQKSMDFFEDLGKFLYRFKAIAPSSDATWKG